MLEKQSLNNIWPIFEHSSLLIADTVIDDPTSLYLKRIGVIRYTYSLGTHIQIHTMAKLFTEKLIRSAAQLLASDY